MALTGVLRADFADFLTAVDQAETKLVGFQTGASKVETSLNRMIDSFSGRKIITEATLAVEAVERIGGAANLTEQEQAKVNRVVTEAIDKYEALKQTAPPAMLELAAATAKAEEPTKALEGSMVALGGAMVTTTAPGIKAVGDAAAGAGKDSLTLEQNFRQVDKVFAAVGINLGPIPGALQEIVTAATQSAGALSLVAQGGLLAASAFAGWKIGRYISEWGDLDEKIGGAWARLRGWGDLAAETAAAKTETLARASEIAGREITNMDQAVRIVTEHTAKLGAEQAKAAEESEKLAEFSAKLFGQDDIARAEQYLAALGEVGNVSKLTADKKKELHAAIGDALEVYAALGERAPAAMRRVFEATTELITVTRSFSSVSSGLWVEFAAGIDDGKAKMAEIAEAAKLHWSDIGGKSREQLEEVARAAEESFALAMQHSENFTGKQIADFRRAAEEARAAVERWGTDTIEAYDAAAAASTSASDVQVGNAGRVTAAIESTTRATMSWSEAMAATARGEGTMTGRITPDRSAAGRASTALAWREGRYYGPVVGGTRENPRGFGPDWAALGMATDEEVAAAAAAPVAATRSGARSAGVAATSGRASGGITINVSTMMGDPAEIARVVQSSILEAARSRGEQLPVGV